MNTASRGIRNAFRNSTRSFSIIVILSLSIGLALAMLLARQAVQDKIESVKQSVGNTITISPAGVQGFQGGGEPLTTEQIDKVQKASHVSSVTSLLNDRLTSDSTNLTSAIEAGSLGNRAGRNSGVGFAPPMGGGMPGGQGAGQTFTPPVMVTGVSNINSTQAFSGNTAKYTAGGAIDAQKDVDEAVVGKTLAEKNSLSVGSTFTMYGKTIKVVGIYDTGNAFANAGLVTSLATLQRLSSQEGSVTSAVATVDSIDNVQTATTTIKQTLGDSADVVSNIETANQVVEPLQNVKSIAAFSLVGAVIAGATIIFLTMVMIVRERRREIGVMKAIGARNRTIMSQFTIEALTLTFVSLIVGVVVGVAAANPVTKTLVNNSSSSTETSQQAPMPGGGGRNIRMAGGISNVRDVSAKVGYDTLTVGLIVAFAIAVVGSAGPAYFISKVRPAEVMRAE